MTDRIADGLTGKRETTAVKTLTWSAKFRIRAEGALCGGDCRMKRRCHCGAGIRGGQKIGVATGSASNAPVKITSPRVIRIPMPWLR